MGRTFKELSSKFWSQLDDAMTDDNALPLPRASMPGEPTSWVAAVYRNSWIKREKLLVIPELTGRGLLVGIVECDPKQTTIQSGKNKISCKYIVDTPNDPSGPLLVVGKNKNTQVTLYPERQPSAIDGEVRSYLEKQQNLETDPTPNKDQLEAFVDFLSLVLATRAAFGIPLESSEEMLEAAESRCLGYLYADLLIRS